MAKKNAKSNPKPKPKAKTEPPKKTSTMEHVKKIAMLDPEKSPELSHVIFEAKRVLNGIAKSTKERKKNAENEDATDSE